MSNPDYISYAYGVAVLFGGAFGYLKAGSLVSLAFGVLFGLAALFGAYFSSQTPKKLHLAFITSASLLTVMSVRFYLTNKFMPAGLMACLSLFQVIRLGVGYVSTNKDKETIK